MSGYTIFFYRGYAICRYSRGRYAIYPSWNTDHDYLVGRATSMRTARALVRTL